ncbi:RagB/SusD family nutrient uptake outer membrane protein [Arenibacter palladensis]|uniref:RagB/SusD family nutrient uptake outer membrane protein n=1 Tax=Arenibacter palladensis TaxID=237373 RepID=UPI0026E252D8|nr:RagB/SusD family nutrient uptake outer membrane protein [Arenibacter palladensis]MDO6605681.1 RagB/SusD family nutrient uptake outer membrane protein [Arenibacter palladensis]
MKDFKLIKTIIYSLAGLMIVSLLSCEADSFLEENSDGFLTPGNAFTSIEGFNAGISELHRLSRSLRTQNSVTGNGIGNPDAQLTTLYASGTDIAWFVVPSLPYFTDYSQINSTNLFVNNLWNTLYRIVSNSNTLIDRARISDLEDQDKLEIEGQARFFRAFAYRYLTHLWGDVPIVSEELTTPKLHFVRSPKEDVLNFMREDLVFASTNISPVNAGDGSLSKAAADHILAETLISLGDYDGAIEAATAVIDDSQYQLMTQRFGNHLSLPGDAFWDLFRADNQNRTSGNQESIWVWQLEFNIPGGEAEHRFTRSWQPRLEQIADSEGNRAILAVDTLGRGVGFVKPTFYLDSLIWQSDFDSDMRNSKYNMQRRFLNNNPDSPDFGQFVVPAPSDLDRNHYVSVQKAASPEGYPQGYDRNGRMYTDIYAIRLAETYLLRAEAYLGKEDTESAADDINIIRQRANASLITASQVNLDFLLDERARELVAEEPRRLTLARVGKLVERVRLYNPISTGSIQDFNNLYPIPQNAIDANIESDLGQNPGY